MSPRAEDTTLPEVMTVEQTAELLQISRGSAYQAVREGELPSFRIGRSVRISRTALLSWINDQERNEDGDDGVLTAVVALDRSTGFQTH